MVGNLAVIYGNQVIVDKVELASVTAAAIPEVLVQSTPSAADGSQIGPFQLNLVIIGLGILTIIIILALIALIVKPKKKPID